MRLGDVIRDRRTAMGMTQADVADRIGVGQKTVSDIERGLTRAPKISTLQQIARVLHMDVEDLIIAADLARGDMAKELRAKHEAVLPPDEVDPLRDAMLFEFNQMDEAGRLLLLEQARLLKKWQADVERMKD